MRRTWAVTLSTMLALSGTRCVTDFVNVPGAGKAPSPPPASRLVFITQPSNAVAGAPIPSSIQIALQDSLGRTVSASGITVNLSVEGGTAGANLRGAQSAATTDGIATFTGLSVDSAGASYTLRASGTGLSNTSSAAFDIAAGPAVRIGFSVQPSNVVAKAKFSPVVRVAVQDSMGNTVSSDPKLIVVDIESGTAGAHLDGDRSRITSNGVATFADLRIDKTGTFTLNADAAGMARVVSRSFSVLEPNDIIGLAVQQQPGTSQAGRPIAPTIRVAAVNSLGNPMTAAAVPITLSIVTGTGAPGARLGGTTTVVSIGGQASFTDLTLDSVGIGYRLLATSPGLTEDTTIAFDIAAGATARLAFQVQPTTQTAGTLAPPPKVAVLDAQGNVVTSATATVALYITAGTGAPGATLGGTTSVAAVNGVATFSNVSIAQAGSGYTLTAVAQGLQSDVSTAFNVTAAGAGSVTITPAGPDTITAFDNTRSYSATVRDAGGNPMPGQSVTWTSENTAVATVDAATGVATAVSNGTATIRATSGSATSTATLVVYQAVASVTVSPDPMTLAPGASAAATAAAVDARGHAVTRALTFTWTSNDPNVSVTAGANTAQATVTRSAAGPQAVVTATTETKSGTAKVN